MQFIDFTFDTLDGRTLDIEGQIEGVEVYFKAYEDENRVRRNSLKQQDIYNIEQFIRENSEPEMTMIADFYDRQS